MHRKMIVLLMATVFMLSIPAEAFAASDELTPEHPAVKEMFTSRDFDPSYEKSVDITLADAASSADAEGVLIDGDTVTITHEALNVRTGPGNTYDVVKFVTKGKSFSYYQTSGDWVRISDGWIYTKGYTDLGGGTVSGTATNITGTVNATELNIRKGPDTSYESVGKYYNGDQVTITETLDGWGKTDKGWVSMKYIKTN